ncbi:MAG TPA: hypothetical protein VFP84_08465, partial [Kofleriaceae bacterium]|nr:hypothetical protein [Kofleriaceae bacterium]
AFAAAAFELGASPLGTSLLCGGLPLAGEPSAAGAAAPLPAPSGAACAIRARGLTARMCKEQGARSATAGTTVDATAKHTIASCFVAMLALHHARHSPLSMWRYPAKTDHCLFVILRYARTSTSQ